MNGAQTDFAGAAGMSVPAVWAKAQKRWPRRPESRKPAANSALDSSSKHSHINSRCGGGYADFPKIGFEIKISFSCFSFAQRIRFTILNSTT